MYDRVKVDHYPRKSLCRRFGNPACTTKYALVPFVKLAKTGTFPNSVSPRLTLGTVFSHPFLLPVVRGYRQTWTPPVLVEWASKRQWWRARVFSAYHFSSI